MSHGKGRIDVAGIDVVSLGEVRLLDSPLEHDPRFLVRQDIGVPVAVCVNVTHEEVLSNLLLFEQILEQAVFMVYGVHVDLVLQVLGVEVRGSEHILHQLILIK